MGDDDEKPVCDSRRWWISILPRGLCVPEACDVRIELIPWTDRQHRDSEGEVGIEIH